MMDSEQMAYQTPDIPGNEQDRLVDLHSLKVLDTASETRFDAYTELVADIFGFPVVLVSLVDRDRQWFKSSHGWSLRQCSRDVSFCGHAINHLGDVFVVPDTLKDPRFAGNPLVLGEPYVRFYAGTVVHGPRGHAIGTLCVIDYEPRQFSKREAGHLRRFAELVENELNHVHDLERLHASIEFSAYYDPLTKLPNRRLMMDRLEHLIELCEPEKRQVMVLLFNIKGLRLINQSYGSDVGDEILNQLADRLRECCPAGGTAARL